MKTKSILSLFVIVFFVIFVPSAFAVSIAIESVPQNIAEEEFTIQVIVTGASSGQNYLRAEFYKEGTTNYFGETNNGNSWYSGSDGKQYFPISIPDSRTAVTSSVTVRIGTPSQAEYTGPGTYQMRIKRYTASGNAATNDEQTPIALQITYSPPTPSNTPMPTPTPTPTPKPTNTPTPSKSPTPTRSPTPTKSPTPVKATSTPAKLASITSPAVTHTTGKTTGIPLSPTPSHGPLPTAILGASTSANTASPTKASGLTTATPEVKEASLSPFAPAVIFIGLGVVVLSSVGALVLKNHLRR